MSAPGRSQALIPEPFRGEGSPWRAPGRSQALIPQPFKGGGNPFRPRQRTPLGHAQRGVTTIVTLLLLIVMLLGGAALARFGEVGTLASGNAAFREAALQASEVGINTAYVAVQGIVDEESNSGNWYWAKAQTLDANGMPSTVNWTTAPELVVGSYKVRYVVERLCTGAGAITDPVRQCVNKIKKPIESYTRRDQLDPPTAKLYRVTVRVTGPRDTQSFVQSLLTRG